MGTAYIVWYAYLATFFAVVIGFGIRYRSKLTVGTSLLAALHLTFAAINSKAPINGFIEPNFHWQWGYVTASLHTASFIASANDILAVASACIILARARNLMAIPILFDAFWALNLGISTVAGTLQQGIASNAIQMGPELTIPGSIGLIILLLVLVAPFFASAWWLVKQMRTVRSATV